MRRNLYRLDPSGKIVHEPSEDVWREWFADPTQRIVASTLLDHAAVETAFCGLDLREFGMWTAPAPLFFACRALRHDGRPLRQTYSGTLLESLADHETMVSHLLRGGSDDH